MRTDTVANIKIREASGNKLEHQFSVIDYKPFTCEQKRKHCIVCKAPDHPKFPKPKCEDTCVIYIIRCNCCGEEYIGETERPVHIRFTEHHKPLTEAELKKLKTPKKNKHGQNMIEEHLPSAISAHAMLVHSSEYNLSIGKLSTKRQQDQRKAYEALACKKYQPSLNRRSEAGNVIPN